MKKIMIVQLLFLCSICLCFAQNRQKFLVFTFNCIYEVGKYKHGSGDNLWIIPYDSCRNDFTDKMLAPLFVDDFQISSLSDSVHLGYYMVDDYSSNSNAYKLLKNRREIQCRTTKFLSDNSVEKLHIYMVPIIAECQPHDFGGGRYCVYTITGEFEIWKDFWDKTDESTIQLILWHNFNNFNHRFHVSPPRDNE